MKKLLLILLGFGLAVGIFGVAGFAYAQTQTPPELESVWQNVEDPGFRRGMRGGRSGLVPGEMQNFAWDEGETGPLHDYLFPAIAQAFGLTDEQIQAFEIVRETIQGIRQDLSQEEIRDAMQQAFTTAIQNALEDGAITAEQAERWLERLEQIGDRLPGTMWGDPGMMWKGRRWFDARDVAGSYRQGIISGFRLGRQMMINHEYLDAAMAEALEISVAELQELRAEEGFSWQAYAEDQGLSADELAALRVEVITNAVNAALADEAITQEQADWVLERLENLTAPSD